MVFRRPSSASSRNCGTWVVFPEPVAPCMTVTCADATVCTISPRLLATGSSAAFCAADGSAAT